MIRQLIGLALGASMLHLNVERADLACATHAHQSAASSHSEHASHDRPVADHAQPGVTETESCEAPAQPDCCQALVTCSIAFGVDEIASPATPVTSHDSVVAIAQRAPVSRVTAPEPPPPKA